MTVTANRSFDLITALALAAGAVVLIPAFVALGLSLVAIAAAIF
jgi:hypothetical protein